MDYILSLLEFITKLLETENHLVSEPSSSLEIAYAISFGGTLGCGLSNLSGFYYIRGHYPGFLFKITFER